MHQVNGRTKSIWAHFSAQVLVGTLFQLNIVLIYPQFPRWFSIHRWLMIAIFLKELDTLKQPTATWTPIIQTKLSPSQPNLTMPPFMPNLVVISYQIQLHTKAKHPKTMQQFSSQNFIPTQLHPIQWHPPAKLTWNLKIKPLEDGIPFEKHHF